METTLISPVKKVRMKVTVNVMNAFSIGSTGGNPAGIVFNADDFPNDLKQLIAKRSGYPETAFISASKIAAYKLDFFTPVKQIAHCGHATIATFSFLKANGYIQSGQSSKETIDGIRTIVFQGNQAFMEQRAPVVTPVIGEEETILRSLHITKNDLAPGLAPLVVDTGNSFLIVPIKNASILAGIDYDRKLVHEVSERLGLIGFYLYATPEPGSTYDATARMFSPFYGIDEEAGTGMAAGPLAVYLYQFEKRIKSSYKIEQGRYMKPASRSLINVNLEIDNGEIIRLFAGGNAYVSGKKIIEIDEYQDCFSSS